MYHSLDDRNPFQVTDINRCSRRFYRLISIQPLDEILRLKTDRGMN